MADLKKVLVPDGNSGSSVQNNYTATTAPTSTDDSSAGYSVGSVWVDTTSNERYVCLDDTAGSAIWEKSTTGTASEIVNTPAGNVSSTDVQSAINELDTEKMANPMTTSGDIIYGGASGTPTRLAKGTDGQVLGLTAGIPTWQNVSGGSDYVLVQNQQPQGTRGDVVSSGGTNRTKTLTLNTEVKDTANVCSIASNQVTLQPGTYIVRANAPMSCTNEFGAKLRLYDVTNSSYVIEGVVSSYTTDWRVYNSRDISLFGLLSISSATTYELRVIVSSSLGKQITQYSLGALGAYSGTEVYSTLELIKIA